MNPDDFRSPLLAIYNPYGAYQLQPARYAPHQRSFAVKRPLRKRFGSHRNDPKRSAKFAQRRGR